MEPLEIDIFLKDNAYYLPGVRCDLVYDRKSEQERKLPSGLENRRCGLRFGRLIRGQRERLDFYLNEYTAEAFRGADAGGGWYV